MSKHSALNTFGRSGNPALRKILLAHMIFQ